MRFHLGQDIREHLERLRKPVVTGSEAQSKVGRVAEAVSRGQQDTALGRRLAHGPGIFAADQVRKRSEAAPRAHPTEYILLLFEKPVEECQIRGGDRFGLGEKPLAVSNCGFSECFTHRAVADREVGARVPVPFSARLVPLDEPTDAETAEAKGLGEVAKDRGMGEHRGGREVGIVVDGVVDLVDDKLDFATDDEVVELAQRVRAYDRTRWIVRGVNENELRIIVHQPLHFIDIDSKVVLGS